jgi:hypothetical protein
MNPNDLIAQQQAIVNQVLQTYQNWVWGMIAIQVALMLIGALVVYMFYARLQDIAEELMKLRVAYEFANPPQSGATRPATPAGPAVNPFQPGVEPGSNPIKLNQTKSNQLNQLNHRWAARPFLGSCQFDQSRLNRASNYGRVTPHSEKPPGNVTSPN